MSRSAYHDLRSDHRTLVASTDTEVVPLTDRQALVFRVVNWDPANRILVSVYPITSDTDATASRVGPAATSGGVIWPNVRVYPVLGRIVHLRSAGASEITLEWFS